MSTAPFPSPSPIHFHPHLISSLFHSLVPLFQNQFPLLLVQIGDLEAL